MVAHFFRFWLWLTTGMVTKEWVAIHRKHHAKVETDDDPHSPQTRGIETVFWKGTELYRAESNNLETIEKYGHATPDDWIERNLYTRFSWQGVGLMLAVNLVLFGPLGATIWAIQMMWIPVTAAGVINGIGHYWGYRTYASARCVDQHRALGHPDRRRRAAQQSPRVRDFGQAVVAVVRVRHRAGCTSARSNSASWRRCARSRPQIRFDRSKAVPDLATLQAVITHRYLVITSYARTLKAAAAAEIAHLRTRNAADHSVDLPSKKRVKRWLLADPATLSEDERAKLAAALAKSKALTTIYAMRQDLASLWERSTESSEQLLARLQDWCHRAESVGHHAVGAVLAAAQAVRVGPRPLGAQGPATGWLVSRPRVVQGWERKAKRGLATLAGLFLACRRLERKYEWAFSRAFARPRNPQAHPKAQRSRLKRRRLRLIESGNASEDAGHGEKALEFYDAAIRLLPGLARAHMNRGNALLALGRNAEALRAYEGALARDPSYAAAAFQHRQRAYARRPA